MLLLHMSDNIAALESWGFVLRPSPKIRGSLGPLYKIPQQFKEASHTAHLRVFKSCT